MKQHLINKKRENKILSYTHRIILGVLLSIFIYELVFRYKKYKFNFFSYEQINLFLNIFYYFLCVIKEYNQKETKKLYQKYFHLCFSISASIPFLYFINLLNDSKELKVDISLIYISFLISPIISNILETLIIKRYKPEYISLIIIILFLILYYSLIHFFGNIGMDIGYFNSKNLIEIKFIVKLFTFSLIGSYGGWWLYKYITKPKIKKINLDSSVDSNDLSEE